MPTLQIEGVIHDGKPVVDFPVLPGLPEGGKVQVVVTFPEAEAATDADDAAFAERLAAVEALWAETTPLDLGERRSQDGDLPRMHKA